MQMFIVCAPSEYEDDGEGYVRIDWSYEEADADFLLFVDRPEPGRPLTFLVDEHHREEDGLGYYSTKVTLSTDEREAPDLLVDRWPCDVAADIAAHVRGAAAHMGLDAKTGRLARWLDAQDEAVDLAPGREARLWRAEFVAQREIMEMLCDPALERVLDATRTTYPRYRRRSAGYVLAPDDKGALAGLHELHAATEAASHELARRRVQPQS